MSKFALKLLLGAGSTGLAFSIPVGMFYGIKGGYGGLSVLSSRDNALQPVVQEEKQEITGNSSRQPKISCQGENGEVQMEYFSDSEEITEEVKEMLQKELSGTDGKCHKFPQG